MSFENKRGLGFSLLLVSAERFVCRNLLKAERGLTSGSAALHFFGVGGFGLFGCAGGGSDWASGSFAKPKGID
ncbi:MAG: hypothetical protein ACP5R4_00075 [Armatimonadota bacterium]